MTQASRQKLAQAAIPRDPVFEPIVLLPSDSFLWRCDDYPMPWSVWNHHPECEIHLIRGATGTCLVGDYIGRFEDGDLCLVGRNLPHDWVTPLPRGELLRQRDIVVQFDQDRLLTAAGALPELAEIRRLLRRSRYGLSFHGAARQMGRELLEAMGSVTGLERLSLFLRLLHVLGASQEFRTLSSKEFEPNLDIDAQGTLRAVLHHMAENYAGDIRLGECARIAAMTESSFSRFFKRMTGNTFSRYLTELRTAKACGLLAGTDRPVSEICFEVGYFNLSNFNRAFRTTRGLSPTQYRQLARR